jgi:hypothetical protein
MQTQGRVVKGLTMLGMLGSFEGQPARKVRGCSVMQKTAQMHGSFARNVMLSGWRLIVCDKSWNS